MSPDPETVKPPLAVEELARVALELSAERELPAVIERFIGCVRAWAQPSALVAAVRGPETGSWRVLPALTFGSLPLGIERALQQLVEDVPECLARPTVQQPLEAVAGVKVRDNWIVPWWSEGESGLLLLRGVPRPYPANLGDALALASAPLWPRLLGGPAARVLSLVEQLQQLSGQLQAEAGRELQRLQAAVAAAAQATAPEAVPEPQLPAADPAVVGRLEDELAAAAERLREARDESARSREETAGVREEAARLSDEAARLRDAVAASHAQAAALQAESASLQGELAALKDEHARVGDDHARLKTEHAALAERLRALEEQKGSARLAEARARAAEEALAAAQQALASHAGALRAEREAGVERHAAHEQALGAAQRALAAEQSERVSAQAELTAAQDELAALRSDLAAAQARAALEQDKATTSREAEEAVRDALVSLHRSAFVPSGLRFALEDVSAALGAETPQRGARVVMLDRDLGGLESLATELEQAGLDVRIANYPEELALLLRTPAGRDVVAAVCDVMAFRPDQNIAGLFRAWEKERAGLAFFLSYDADSSVEMERARRVPLSLTAAHLTRPLLAKRVSEAIEALLRRQARP